MTDYINKKVNFVQSKLSAKIIKRLSSNDYYKFYLCTDSNNSSISYLMKMAQVRSDDKALCNLINTEIVILVKIYFKTALFEKHSECDPNDRLLLRGER